MAITYSKKAVLHGGILRADLGLNLVGTGSKLGPNWVGTGAENDKPAIVVLLIPITLVLTSG